MKTDWSMKTLKEIVENSFSRKEVLSKLNLRDAGSNFKTFNKYVELYSIDISHFIKNYQKINDINRNKKIPLDDILVENSTYHRHHLKERLYKEGLLDRECCLCGQDENWNGMIISLIIDHKNGIPNDNRLGNLRIVCPNCNAGLETFAGKNNKIKINLCECGLEKTKNSKKCNSCEKITRRKIQRPEYEILLKEVNEFGFCAIGRKYNVSDNTIRKWLNTYKKKFNNENT